MSAAAILNLSEEIKISGYNRTDTCNTLCVKINMTVELRKVSKRSKVIHELYTNPINL